MKTVPMHSKSEYIMSASGPFPDAWKEPFNPYNSSKWNFDQLISGLLLIGHYRSFPSASAILFTLVTEKFMELWTDQKQTGDSALIHSKGTKTIYINSIRIMRIFHYNGSQNQ